MKKALLYVVVPLAILVASLWAVPFILPTSQPRPTMTRAERVKANEKAVAIAAELERKEQRRERQQAVRQAALDKIIGSTPANEPSDQVSSEPVKRFATVEDYFAAGNPNPLSHRRGLRNYDRDVSEKTKKEVKKRDGNCCLVCGSTRQLEVDHRIALMNGGDNSKGNLGTLCDSCHNKKTRLGFGSNDASKQGHAEQNQLYTVDFA